MKRKTNYFLIFIITACMLSVTMPVNAQKIDITYSAGSLGSTGYALGSMLTELMNQRIPEIRATVTPGSSVTNIPRVSTNQAQIGLTNPDLIVAGIKGEDPFKEAYPNNRVLVKTQKVYYQFVVTEKTGLKSIDEFVEKKYPLRIVTLRPGSVTYLALMRTFEAYGISPDTIKSWGGKLVPAGGPGDAVNLIRDDHADSTFFFGGVQPLFVELGLVRRVKLIAPSMSVMQKLADEYGYSIGKLPEGSYDFQEKGFETIFIPQVLNINKDIPEEIVYKISKLLFEPGTLKKAAAVGFPHFGDEMGTLEEASKGIGGELHPGVVKHLKEKESKKK